MDQTQAGDVRKEASKRKRAPIACVLCRSRKVRCNVAYTGTPCTNCVLDASDCVVMTRRKNRSPRPKESANTSPLYHNHQDGGTDIQTPTQETPENHERDLNNRVPFDSMMNTLVSESDRESASCSNNGIFRVNPVVNEQCPRLANFGVDVPYSSLPFLTLDNIGNLDSVEINFLEMQGCLRIPKRSYLQEFVREYFLRVHPLLPILEESISSNFFESKLLASSNETKLSLFILQGILFVSCGFVRPATLRALGFDSILDAKSAFYRRAKTLANHDAVCDAIDIAQGALLLTYWGQVDDGIRKNTSWLILAIRNAENAGAHWRTPSEARFGTRRRLRRLWWCCLIRDRLMSLGLRRPILMTRDHLDSQDDIEYSMKRDLDSTMLFERVYGTKHKDTFGSAFVSLCNLCIFLTDVLLLVHPLHESTRLLKFQTYKIKASACHSQLNQWYSTSFSPLTAELSSTEPDEVQTVVSLLSIYYQAARVSLYQSEIWHISALSPGHSDICAATTGLQDAAQAITATSEDIFKRGQSIYLPSTAAACTALPLLLAVLDTRLAKQRSVQLDNNGPIVQLDSLIKIMNVYRCQYEGVNTISEAIRRLFTLEALPEAGSWKELIAAHPDVYLKFVISLDRTLSKGRHLEYWEVLYDNGLLSHTTQKNRERDAIQGDQCTLGRATTEELLDEFISLPDDAWGVDSGIRSMLSLDAELLSTIN